MASQILQYLLTADDKASKVFAKVRGEIEGIGKSSGLLRNTLGLIGPALVGAFSVSAITGFIKSTVSGIDALNDLKDATGSSIENLSALEDVALRTGTSMETAGDAVIKLNKALNTASDPKSDAASAIKALGLSVEELKKLDPVVALQKIGVALSGFADNGQKGRIQLVLLGKATKEQAALLKDLAEAGTLNAKVTTEQAEAAEKFNKELFALEKNTLDLSRSLAGPMVESINKTILAFREGEAAGKSYYTTLLDEQLKLLGFKGNPIQDLQSKIQAFDAALANPQMPEMLRAGFIEKRAKAAEELAKMVKSANSDFLRNDKDRTPVDKPSLPDLPQDNTAALKKASESRRRLAEESAQAEADVEEQSAKDTAEAWGFYNEIIVRDSKEKTDALKQQWQQVFDAIDQEQTDAINEGQAFIEAQAETIKQTASSTAQDIALVFSSAAGEAINNWQGFGNLLKGIFKDLNQIVLKALVIKPLEDSIGSALKGFSLASLFGAANGAAFGGSGVIPFASGGVVNSPTLFRFAKGTGLMGEAGPEAILPLSRGRNGKLGVQGGGSALTYSPVIQIDSRTDQAQVAQLVGGMLAADKQQLFAYLKAQGAMA